MALARRLADVVEVEGDDLGDARGAYDALVALADSAGINVGRDAGEFTPHALRHTAGTTLTRAGTEIVIVAEILGHSAETARRYACLRSRTARPPSNGSPSTDEGSCRHRGGRRARHFAPGVMLGSAPCSRPESFTASSVRAPRCHPVDLRPSNGR
ncbi:MAG: site-specific integrase [Actinobacteria bacterium]|nr:site-specific integrase [Actinomycetota bacterium]